MALVISERLEKRIQAVVDAGAFSTRELALEAAVELVEAAAQNDFDGSPDELGALLKQGLDSKLMSEEEFWKAADAEIEEMFAVRAADRKA
jgi:glutamate-1-semialdehyde aminotransferase